MVKSIYWPLTVCRKQVVQRDMKDRPYTKSPSRWCMVGRMMAPQRVHTLIVRTCYYVTWRKKLYQCDSGYGALGGKLHRGPNLIISPWKWRNFSQMWPEKEMWQWRKSEKHTCNVRRSRLAIAGFEDGERRSWAKKCGSPLEAGKSGQIPPKASGKTALPTPWF